MAENLLPDFKIDKDEMENGIRELLKIIKPQWNQKRLQITPLTGGFSSKIFKCCDSNEPDDAVTVPIRFALGNSDGIKNFKYDIEPDVIQYLSKFGHFPKIYSTFANGYCYQYVKGDPIVNTRMKTGVIDEKVLKSIAEEMVYIHSVKVEGLDYTADEFLERMDMIASVGPIQVKHDLVPTKETILDEINFIKEFVKNFDLPLVLCHADPHLGNIIRDNKNDKVTLVDWEGTCIGYRHVEIAQFLVFVLSFLSNAKQHQMKNTVPDDFENKFISFYFTELCRAQKRKNTDEEYEKFKEIVHKCKLVQRLMHLTMSLTIPEEGTEYFGDNTKFFEVVLNEYLNLKEKVFGKRKFQADLK